MKYEIGNPEPFFDLGMGFYGLEIFKEVALVVEEVEWSHQVSRGWGSGE